jgi:7,8-didemethyl-8-hydroxy-5-deazariboflavin synthase CofG subunit
MSQPTLSAALPCHQAKGSVVTFSAKVFIPVTRLCRNACSYCDYVAGLSEAPFFVRAEEALAIARAGESAGCAEALFVAGDKPERRYPAVRAWLWRRGYDSTAHYTRDLCRLVLAQTRLYPHTNVGVLGQDELGELREVNASLGLMLETTSASLCLPGGPHALSPDKRPAARLATLEAAGRAKALMTTGLLIGVGETIEDRTESLLAIKRIHDRYGHIQEVIIQNVRPRPGVSPGQAGSTLAEVLSTLAAARRILGPHMNLQVPPNLALQFTGELKLFLEAGANDWGGVSPVTKDHINPDAPWPDLQWLRRQTESAGFTLRQRFPAYPEFVRRSGGLLSAPITQRLMQDTDPEGYVRDSRFSD